MFFKVICQISRSHLNIVEFANWAFPDCNSCSPESCHQQALFQWNHHWAFPDCNSSTDSHYRIKTVRSSCDLCIRNSCAVELVFLYWNCPQVITRLCISFGLRTKFGGMDLVSDVLYQSKLPTLLLKEF